MKFTRSYHGLVPKLGQYEKHHNKLSLRAKLHEEADIHFLKIFLKIVKYY